MTGKAGCSGGARPNSGPPKKDPVKLDIEEKDDPLDFLLAVMNDQNADATLRLRAATVAAKLKRERAGGTGKKGEQKRSAESAATGKYAPGEPPRLAAVGGKRI